MSLGFCVFRILIMNSQDMVTEDILQSSYAYGDPHLSPESRASEREIFLIGTPIAHSLAPSIHLDTFKSAGLASWTYQLFETSKPALFRSRLSSEKCQGAAITMPYKVELISQVDAVTEDARVIGAINTVMLRRRPHNTTRYIGANTDSIGVREAFLQNFPNILDETRGRPAMVIGGGGACRSAVYALSRWMGASPIYIVNRLEEEAKTMIAAFKKEGFDANIQYIASLEEVQNLEAPAAIVGTVPDFAPKTEGELIANRLIQGFLVKEKKGYVLEMCYFPKIRTAFCELAENAGWKVLPGTEALLYQAIAQDVLWTEVPLERIDVERARTVMTEALAASRAE